MKQSLILIAFLSLSIIVQVAAALASQNAGGGLWEIVTPAALEHSPVPQKQD